METGNAFKAIDDKADAKIIERIHAETRSRHIMDKVLECEHRKPTGFYNVKCHHPFRADHQHGDHRQCLDTSCPLFKDIL